MEQNCEPLKTFLHGKGTFVERCHAQEGSGYEKLTVKQNIGYIVAGIIINDKNEVLMVQEAKPSCYKKWYLPAGRMERNETIVEAVKREVLEEAGLLFEPTSLLCVEECGGRWLRFSFAGKVVGGTLKTTDEADEESLQAMWWNREDDIPIRCMDIYSLIKLGVERKITDPSKCVVLLPSLKSQSLLFLRVLVLYKPTLIAEVTDCSILLARNEQTIDKTCDNNLNRKCSVPTARIHPEDTSFREAVKSLLLEALAVGENGHQNLITISGVLNIEHTGASSSDHDGLGLSIVVQCSNNGQETPECNEGYTWFQIKDIHNETVLSLLENKLQSENLIPLRSLKAKL